ncbi:MAG: formate dehydrogenase [Burkholderiales bacterium]
MSDKNSKLSRRQFLTVVGIGSAASAAAVAVAVTAKIAPSSKSPATSTDKRRGKGYQVTEHVQSYYRTTRV